MASERTTGHTALVTGGTGGLGAAIARALHDAGHAVLVSHSPGNARVRAWLDAQAAEGYRFAAYSGDVADEASCRDMVVRIHADGHAVVYKAVSPELEAGQSHRLTAYPIGETVAAPDWDPRKARGNGLHFSPTPRQALRYYQGPDSTKARYLACRVVLDTLVPLDDKCKAPSCEVLHEVTIDGEAVTA